MAEYLIMDESSAPYNENDKSYKRTLEDDIFLLEFVKKNNLELDPNSRLAKLQEMQYLFPVQNK